jgi:hypothetical protein
MSWSAGAPREAIDAGDHKNVAGVQEFQDGPESLTAFGRGPAPLLRPDDLAAGRLKRRLLDRQVLISRARPGVPNDGHGPAPIVSFGSRPFTYAVLE